MSARFIGQDRSLGYRNGQVYNLHVKEWSAGRPMIMWPHECPYRSWDTFYNNWLPVE